jgi:hypothetical protein
MQDAILLILGPVVLVVVVALLASRLQDERPKQLRQAAAALGFRFAEGDPVLAEELFGRQPGLRLLNVMRGEAEGLEVIVFDLHRALSRTGAVMHARFTVVFFRDPSATWPLFSLRPLFFLEQLTSSRRGNKRLFQGDIAFARKYTLEAEDEEAVGAVFSEGVRRFFARHPVVWLEGSGPRLFYTRSKLVAARSLHAFLAEAFRVRKVLETGEVEHSW